MRQLSRRGVLLGAGAALALAHPWARAAAVRTGGARMVEARGHQVWVKQVGSGRVPVLTLHGGPGFNHFYLECLEDFLPQSDVRFWYYDQLGCGFSDRPEDDSLWTVDGYRDEVEEVRRALGLDRFVLYGHSWGGMLGMEYALRYPQHLSGLVISNMTASCAAYVRHAEQLLAALPASAIAVIQRHRATGDYQAAEYQDVLFKEVYRRHFCRLDPWPEPVQRSLRTINSHIYNLMQGPDEFNIVGNFKDWDIWDRLKDIRVPTLLIGARYDEMDPDQIRRMGTLIPHSRVVICPEGSHLALYDDQARYFAALLPFLHEAHGRQRAG
jgi:proline iminopeptidase